MRFESKRDLWIVLVLRVTPLLVLAIITGTWYVSRHDVRGPIGNDGFRGAGHNCTAGTK